MTWSISSPSTSFPYWEDVPIRAKFAATHVNSIRQRMAVAFPGKEILIGETGWPSEGRMREGALPSRTNQARVVSEILLMAKQQNFRVNLIEAYDQPWKRQLEGTVGGYWGLFNSAQRALKYPPDEPISNFPFWKWQMGAGLGFSIIVFVSAWATTRRRPWTPLLSPWIAVGLIATSAGILLGVAADKMFYESYGIGGWVKWGALLLASLVASVLGANAVVSGRSLPTFLDMFGPRGEAVSKTHVLDVVPGREPGGHHADRDRDRARLRVRSALPRFSLCEPDHGGGALRLPDAQPIAGRSPPDRGGGICRAARGIGDLYRCQRRPRQLAVAVDLGRLSPARVHAVAGAGRAKPKINSPIASPDSTML